MKMVHFIPPSQRKLAMLAAQAESAPVLIIGASGTGKGAIAQWIHSNSPRAAKALIATTRNASLASQILSARGGSIIITEIAEWPLAEQKVLLQFLQSKSVPHPNNPQTRVLVNARIIATTSHRLEARAQGGLFNIELLEKLNVFRLEMPPLCRRTAEFEDIALGILFEITRELHKEHVREIDADAWERLRAYDWPGNLRELRNVLRISVIAAQGDRLEAKNLPDFGHNRVDFHATREEFEKTYILELLRTFNWEIDTTCRMARMDKTTLLSKMKKYEINVAETSIP